MKPVIGISCNFRARDGEFVCELQERYVQAVEQAGGLVLALPCVRPEDAAELARVLDGVVTSGGRDIPPDFYGSELHPATKTGEAMRERVKFEIALVRTMAEANKPVLGICHGCQLLNVALTRYGV